MLHHLHHRLVALIDRSAQLVKQAGEVRRDKDLGFRIHSSSVENHFEYMVFTLVLKTC